MGDSSAFTLQPQQEALTSQATVRRGFGRTHLGMERRRPPGLVETEECWAQRADAVQTQKAAAGPCRTVGAWAWPLASPGGAERPQSRGFQFLVCCCQGIKTKVIYATWDLGLCPRHLPYCSAPFPSPGFPLQTSTASPCSKRGSQPEREKAVGCTLPALS